MTSIEDLSDERIVEAVLEGDTQAFSLLVKRHQRSLYRFGRGFFHNDEEASDFVQDVFLKVYVKLASFRGTAKFSTWLFKVGYNAAINTNRGARRFMPLDEEISDPGLSVEDAHLRNEAVAALGTAMKNLPERQAVCIDLFFFNGMAYTDISAVTGYPVNTIKSHVFRAKKELRKALERSIE